MDVIGVEGFYRLFTIECAHRIPSHPLPPGSTPRPIIIKLLNYRDRDSILSKARQQSNIKYNGNTESFFPDFFN